MREIIHLFLKLGMFAFGGPAAHIAMMENEVVRKREWMSEQSFLDLLGVTSLIPGPNSTEMAICCGYHRGGVRGLFLAGFFFIVPAVTITLMFAWIYVKYSHSPVVAPFFYGIKPAVIAVILSAVYRLGKKALKGWQTAMIGIAVVAAALYGVSEVIAILVGGFVGMLLLYKKPSPTMSICPTLAILFTDKLRVSTAFLGFFGLTNVSFFSVFGVFLKVGTILFGSGYVLVAYLDAELIQRLQWLTRQELLDAIAIGQFTPGPVLSTATFVGFQLHSFSGAIAATLGIFLPSFIFVLLLTPIIPKLRNSQFTTNFLDAVNISAVGIMLAVVWEMGLEVVVSWQLTTIFATSTVLVFLPKKIDPVWIVVFGASAGYIFYP
ncbi:chromate efflux transporter [Candidatus Uabimicrobium sp. HlEnr_7]|uniref:chromate efflux transporter n=1 Tax=Candidatus Uabimicrobium helgolandensis TaxID=3095367 RepID=UPI003555E7A0